MRRKLENVLDQFSKIEIFPNEGGILERPGRQRPLVHPGVNDRRLRKQSIPISRHKAAGGRSDRYHQVRMPFRQAFEQKLDERFFHVRLRVARHVQRHFIKIDSVSQLTG